MKVKVDYTYTEPIIATIYNEDGTRFMRSELKVNILDRPYYYSNSGHSCTERQYLKWKDKVATKINKAVLKSLPEELYGTINIDVIIPEHHGL